jgi:tetratricopeptide (TPR) repeat protein
VRQFLRLGRPLAGLPIVLLIVLQSLRLMGQAASTELFEKYFQDGERALAESRYADAERAYTGLQRLAPGMPEVYGRLGLVYFQEGKFEEAVSTLRRGLKLKPSLPRADILLAMSLSELGRFKEALPGLEKGFKMADPNLKRMTGLQLQRAYTGLGKDSEAVEVALELSRLYPKDPEILYHTARLFGNFAFLNMRKLAEVAPESTWKYQAAGEVHESQGNYELAIEAYKQVLARNATRPGVHLRIGRVLLAARKGEFETAAAKEFEAELQLDPTNANAAYELGEILRRQGQLEKSRELFEFALKYYPDFDEAHIGLGRVLLTLKQPAPALEHLKRAAALAPENAVAYFHLVRAYQAAGNAAEQQKALAQFRRIQTDAFKRQETGIQPFSPREVTRQELDPAAAP